MNHVSTPRTWILTLGVVLVVAVGSGVIASDGQVDGWEEEIFHAFNDLPDRLETPMWVFQLAGLLFVPVVVAVVAVAFRRMRLAIALVALVPLKLIVERAIVKQLVARHRPATTICGYPDPLYETCGEFRDVPLLGLSFVSGHAIIAWGIATLLWPVLPRGWRWVPVVVAASNTLARVYLGAHNPLDLVAGAAIGIALGVVLAFVTGLLRDASERESGRPGL